MATWRHSQPGAGGHESVNGLVRSAGFDHPLFFDLMQSRAKMGGVAHFD